MKFLGSLRSITSGIAITASLLSTAAHSDNFRIDLSAGNVNASNVDYDTGLAGMAGVSFNVNSLILGAGVLQVIELRPDNQGDDSELSVTGVYFGLAKEIDFKVLTLELGGGGVYAETKAEFRNREVGSDDDVSPYVNVRLVKGFGPFFSLQGGYQYIDDLSGGNLHLLQAGVRFSF